MIWTGDFRPSPILQKHAFFVPPTAELLLAPFIEPVGIVKTVLHNQRFGCFSEDGYRCGRGTSETSVLGSGLIAATVLFWL
jgi:hypothetical protein